MTSAFFILSTGASCSKLDQGEPWVKIQPAVLVCVFLHVRYFKTSEKKLLINQTGFLKKYFQAYKQAVKKLAFNFTLTQA